MTSNLSKLKNAKTLTDVAELLGYPPSSLSFILYVMPKERLYNEFYIPKRDGGQRRILAPHSKLKSVQRRLANILYDCAADIERERDLRPLSYGYHKGLSIFENANEHTSKRYVFNIDLSGFFESINFGRVRGFFISDRYFSLNPNVATILAQICCYENHLPQGSPASPVVSNFIGNILDNRLVKLAKSNGVHYTRYVDDITFSTNKKQFPKEIAKTKCLINDNWVAGKKLKNVVERSGFKINLSKVRMHTQGSRQMATGLIVNDGVNVKVEKYRYARSMCNSFFSTGQYYLPSDYLPHRDHYIDTGHEIEGILAHIYYIKFKSGRLTANKNKGDEATGIEKIYSNLLFFNRFVKRNNALIITEGHTDEIYIREAIKSRAASHPTLVNASGKEKVLNFSFFRFTNLATRLLGVSRGGSGLNYFITEYSKKLEYYKYRPLTYPVIYVVDSDDGIKSLASALNGKYKTGIDWDDDSKSFYHITGNLYLVKVPMNGSSSSCTESLFSQDDLKHEIDGRKFELNPDLKKGEPSYGKDDFANKIVRNKNLKIDFSGFDALLNRITGVIEFHSEIINTEPNKVNSTAPTTHPPAQ